jgi:hypothetical protein
VTRIGGNPDFSGAIEGGLGIADGLFVHPGNDGPTEVVYRHNGFPAILRGQATVVDCIGPCGGRGSVAFVIRGDGRELWNSGLMRQAEPGKEFAVDMTGVREARLIATDGGNGTAQDWAAWLALEIRNSITPVSTP